MKRLVPNPEYAKALYVEGYIWQHGVKCGKHIPQFPEVRTNNPNYVIDGRKPEDRIPSHIEVDD